MINRYFNPSNLLNKNQSIFLFGARGTGKTALIQEALKNQPQSLIYDFLKGEVYQRYIAEPQLLRLEIEEHLQRESKGRFIVAIDEVQRIPEVLNEVHSLIESYKSRVCFLLTGSSARKLKRGGANLLAGRAITINFHPLSILDLDLNLSRALQWGTLPGIYLDEDFALQRLNSYVGTYLREEIKEESLVRRIDRFTKFLDLAAQLNGEPINHSKLGRALSTTPNTIQDYFSILVDTWICHRIDGWSESIKRQLMQAPKYYFFDCGVLNSLNGELRTEPQPSSFRYGRLFETFIVSEIIKHSDYLELGLRLSYWRDQDGHEVDLILYRSTGKPVAAIEIKSSARPDPSDLKGLELFRIEYPNVPRFCFCTTPHTFSFEDVTFLNWKEGLKMLSDL